MNPRPTVSILLSVYNGASFLEQALESLRRQTRPDWECLVMNDGSRDASQHIIAEFAGKDRRFKPFIHSQALGLTASLIELSRSAEGDFLMRQDADDWSVPDRLQMQMDYLASHRDMALTGCWFSIHDENGNYLDTVRPFSSPLLLRRSLRSKNPLAHGSLLLRRDCYEAAGGYRSAFSTAQDYDLLLRLSERYALGCIPRPLYHVRLSGGGIGRAKLDIQSQYAALARSCASARQRQKDDAALIRSFAPWIPDSPPEANQRISQMAFHLVRSCQRRRAREAFKKWRPHSSKDRFLKAALTCLNLCPAVVVRLAAQVGRLSALI